MKLRPARSQEEGFAMLVVFLLAALIAISLYRELPRVVLESQRDREEMLIDRGEQYKRAIQLYFRRMGRYPPDLDALENTNNMRFLRRRYKDPMTGQDEWRLIHATGLGIFPDSLVYAPANPQQSQASASVPSSGEEAQVPLWLQQRPSDMILAPAEAASVALPEADTSVVSSSQPQGPQQFDLQMPGPGQTAVASVSVALAPGAGPGAEAAGPGVASGAGPQPLAPGSPGVVAVGPNVVTPGPPSAQAQQGAAGSNPALQLINRLLTSPAQRSAAVTTQTAAQPQQIGGIAGVASKLESEGIKVYNDRTSYHEWEFLYDVRQDRLAMAAAMRQQSGGAGGPGGTPDTSRPVTGPQGGPFGPGGRGGPMGPGRGPGGGRGGFGGGGFGGQGGFGPGTGIPFPQQPVPGRGP